VIAEQSDSGPVVSPTLRKGASPWASAWSVAGGFQRYINRDW